MIENLGGQWSNGSSAGRFALSVHDLNRGLDIGCRAVLIPQFTSGGRATHDMIKTEMQMVSPNGNTYPIYYCTITERYFIKLAHLLWEVEYKCVHEFGRKYRKWVQTGIALPVEGKERNNDEALC